MYDNFKAFPYLKIKIFSFTKSYRDLKANFGFQLRKSLEIIVQDGFQLRKSLEIILQRGFQLRKSLEIII